MQIGVFSNNNGAISTYWTSLFTPSQHLSSCGPTHWDWATSWTGDVQCDVETWSTNTENGDILCPAVNLVRGKIITHSYSGIFNEGEGMPLLRTFMWYFFLQKSCQANIREVFVCLNTCMEGIFKVFLKSANGALPQPVCVCVLHLTPDFKSLSVWVRMMLKTACDRLLSSFMLVAATVRDLFPSDIRDSTSYQNSGNQTVNKWRINHSFSLQNKL